MKIVIDLDHTLTKGGNGSYADALPDHEMISRVRWYKEQGWEVIIYTSRNMRTFGGDLGRINAETLPVIVEWLKRNDVPFDSIYVGKPWCGDTGFYVDDRAIRPSEFLRLSPDAIEAILSKDGGVR